MVDDLIRIFLKEFNESPFLIGIFNELIHKMQSNHVRDSFPRLPNKYERHNNAVHYWRRSENKHTWWYALEYARLLGLNAVDVNFNWNFFIFCCFHHTVLCYPNSSTVLKNKSTNNEVIKTNKNFSSSSNNLKTSLIIVWYF